MKFNTFLIISVDGPECVLYPFVDIIDYFAC